MKGFKHFADTGPTLGLLALSTLILVGIASALVVDQHAKMTHLRG